MIGDLRHKIKADIGQPHPHLGGDVFDIFRQQQPERRATGPPRLVAPFVADHGERDQRDIRHRVRHFGDGARHMIVRGHHDQRLEAALMDPAPRLGGIAAGVDGGTVEIDATAEQRLVVAAANGKCRWRRWSDARRRSTAACHSRRPAIPSRRTPATSRRSEPRCRRRLRPAWSRRRATATEIRRSRPRRATNSIAASTGTTRSAARQARRRGACIGYRRLAGSCVPESLWRGGCVEFQCA